MSTREYSHVINIFLVLIPVWIEVKRSRIRHVAPSIIGDDSDIVAYLVLIRIAFERIKGIAHRDVRGPGNASVGAKGIKQLRIGVVGSVSTVVPDSIQASVGRYRECSKPVPLAGINRIVIDLDRRAKRCSVVRTARKHHVGCVSPRRYHAGQHVNIVVSRATGTINRQE